MRKILLSKYFPFALYLAVSIIFLWPVVSQNGLPFKYDWNWPLFDLDWFAQHLFDFSNFSILTVFGKYSGLTLSLFGLIVHYPLIGLKLYLLLITTFAAFGFHLFIKDKIKSEILALLVPVFYAFTPYLFIRIIVGFQSSQIAYAALPFFYYFYFKKTKLELKNLFLAAVALSFVFTQSQAGFLVGLTILITLFVSIFYKSFLLELKKISLLIGWFLILNLPWLVVLFTHKSAIGVGSGSDVTTLSSIADLPHSLRNVLMLSDHHITRDFFYALAREKYLVVGFALIFIIALFSFLNKSLRRYTLIFSLSALIILPFTIGPTGRFAEIFTWIFNHFSILALFRETYHFEFLLAFVLVLLFALGADCLICKIKNHQTVISIILSGLGLFMIAPFLTFDFAGYLNLQKVPSTYQDFTNYLKESSTCQKIYYPPNLGFNYFKNDTSRDAVNSDLLAIFTGVPYTTEASSVLNVANEEMFERNLLTSLYLDRTDTGQFAAELQNSGADCLVVRTDLDTKYDQVSNLWREKDPAVRSKWFQSDMLTLARSKPGLEEVKSFGSRIYIFKINPKSEARNPKQIQNSNDQIGQSASQQFSNLTIQQLPITSWAKEFDYYKDGWSRGRYTFWRKELFAYLKQDFIYTDKQDSVLTGKIYQTGKYELWVRYLTGGSAGNFQFSIFQAKPDPASQDNFQKTITKDPGEERFVWQDLGEINVSEDEQIEIKNISGENAIADLVLVSK